MSTWVAWVSLICSLGYNAYQAKSRAGEKMGDLRETIGFIKGTTVTTAEDIKEIKAQLAVLTSIDKRLTSIEEWISESKDVPQKKGR